MSDDETSDSRADLLRRELVLLRDRSGISTSKVRERAPNLMHLPCVDAELERRGWRDADRAHAAVVVLRCTVENGALDETPKALLRITLNFAVVPDNLDERRRVVQEQLNQLDFQKAYFSYEGEGVSLTCGRTRDTDSRAVQ
ncbi:hypothetical protein JM654_15400 [Microbacterium oxydans]|nr:hypothetical protein [Microbacterium oxydans]